MTAYDEHAAHGAWMEHLSGQLRAAEIERDEARAEAERLRDWKGSARTVIADWEAVWVALGSPGELGTSKAHAARVEVERLRVAVYGVK